MKKYTQMRLLPSLYDIGFFVHVEIVFNDTTHDVIDHVYLKNTVSNTVETILYCAGKKLQM